MENFSEPEETSRRRARKATDGLLALLAKNHSLPPRVSADVERPCYILAERCEPVRAIPNRQFAVAWKLMGEPVTFSRGRVDTILMAVARFYPGVSVNDIKSSRRTAKVVRPRMIAIYLAKELTGRSLPEIGRRLGGRDHTTILHSVRKIANQVENVPGMGAYIEAIKATIPELT